MAIIKAYTDLSQSKKLAEILPLESADMYIDCTNPYYIHTELKHIEHFDSEHYPCWSLAALLSVLPHIQEFYPFIEKINDKFVCRYKGSDIWTNGANPVDACYEMILKLHELNLL